MTLLDIIWNSTDLEHLYILPEGHPRYPWKIDFFVNPPATEPWTKVKGHAYYTKENIYQHHHMTGVLDDFAKENPTDSGHRWKLFDTLFERGHAEVVANLPIKIKFLEELYLHSIGEGVTYIETRSGLGSSPELIYVLDSEYESSNGKKYLDTTGEYDVQVTLEVIENITNEHPQFIGHKRILAAYRQQTHEDVQSTIDRTASLSATYPHHIVGFDMVGHEDAGNSHLYYLAELLRQHGDENGRNSLSYFLHTAETKWPDDLLTSGNVDDPLGTCQNVYEALLLGAKRVGHGTCFTKHPYLTEVAKQNEVAIEVCPVSAQILGYYPDLRNHPGISLFRSGGDIVLGSDDAGVFGVDDFTVDWYEVFMAWGLDLADLKQLALLSLKHSSMSEEERHEAIQTKWKPSWEQYIHELYQEACSLNLSGMAQPLFSRILPREGTSLESTAVHIFGRNFESGICNEENIKCMFGNMESPRAFYKSNQHIICESPIPETGNQQDFFDHTNPLTVSVLITLNGIDYLVTGENFTYTNELSKEQVPNSQSKFSVSAFSWALILVKILQQL